MPINLSKFRLKTDNVIDVFELLHCVLLSSKQ